MIWNFFIIVKPTTITYFKMYERHKFPSRVFFKLWRRRVSVHAGKYADHVLYEIKLFFTVHIYPTHRLKSKDFQLDEL